MSVYEYKGYLGSAEVDGDVVVGKLLFIQDSIAYSASTPKELEAAFREAVDDYLETCAEHGDQPDVPCKGSFNVRIDPDLHRRAALEARTRRITLNQLVGVAMEAVLAPHSRTTVQVIEVVRHEGVASGIASAGIEPITRTVHGRTTH